jgi:hypothetical protein
MIFILECGREESCETDGVGSEYERRCGSCNNLVGRESRRHPRVRFFLGARGPFLQFANNFLRPCSSFAGEISLIAKQCSGLFTALYTGVLCSLHCLAMRRDGPLLQQNEETRTKEDGAIVTQVSSHQCTSHSTLGKRLPCSCQPPTTQYQIGSLGLALFTNQILFPRGLCSSLNFLHSRRDCRHSPPSITNGFCLQRLVNVTRENLPGGNNLSTSLERQQIRK